MLHLLATSSMLVLMMMVMINTLIIMFHLLPTPACVLVATKTVVAAGKKLPH